MTLVNKMKNKTTKTSEESTKRKQEKEAKRKSIKKQRIEETIQNQTTLVTELAQQTNVNDIDIHRILLQATAYFTYNTTLHTSFDNALKEAWTRIGLVPLPEAPQGVICATLIKDKRKKTMLGTRRRMIGGKITYTLDEDMLAIARICPRIGRAGRILITRSLYTQLMLDIFTKTNWTRSVTSISQVPPSLCQAIQISCVPIENVFHGIKVSNEEKPYNQYRELPGYMESVVCVNRLLYHKQAENSAPQSIEDDIFDLPVFSHDKRFTDTASTSDDEDNVSIADDKNEATEDEYESSASSGSESYSSSSDDTAPNFTYEKDYTPARSNSLPTQSPDSSSEGPTGSPYKPTFQSDTNMPKLIPVYLKEKSDIVMASDYVVWIRQLKERRVPRYANSDGHPQTELAWEEIRCNTHPYTMSAVIFTFAVGLSKELYADGISDWGPRRIYLYVKDYLADQLPVIYTNPPDKVKVLARDILYIVSDVDPKHITPLIYKNFKLLTTFYADIQGMLLKHVKPESEKIINTPRDGRLVHFKLLTDQEFNALVLSDFYSFHESTIDREPAVLHCQCKRSSCKPRALVFQRSEVSPLQLQTSLETLERHFIVRMRRNLGEHAKYQLWTIAFTDQLTILIINPSFLADTLKKYVPHMLTRNNVIERRVPYPVYYLHLHNYFYGDELSLIITMKFILRCFCLGQSTTHLGRDKLAASLMPQKINDPLIAYYRLLHKIIDKFGSRETIWASLIAPLKSTDLLWFRRNENGTMRLTGLKEDTPSFYTAIRSFILVNAQHFIVPGTLVKLHKYFLDNHMLQLKHKLAFDLILQLMDEMDSRDTESVRILGGVQEEVEHPDDAFMLCGQPFNFPSHILLYILAAGDDLPNDLAIELFISMTMYTKKRGYNGTCTNSTRIRFRPHIPRFKTLEKHAHHMVYASARSRKATRSVLNELKANSHIPTQASGFEFFLQALEELSYHQTCHVKTYSQLNTDTTYRGNVPEVKNYVTLNAEEILVSQEEPPSLPIDCTDRTNEPIYWNNSFPIWKANVYDPGANLTSSAQSCPIALGELDALPIYGSHRDFLSCLLLQPIISIDAIYEWDKRYINNQEIIPDNLGAFSQMSHMPFDERVHNVTIPTPNSDDYDEDPTPTNEVHMDTSNVNINNNNTPISPVDRQNLTRRLRNVTQRFEHHLSAAKTREFRISLYDILVALNKEAEHAKHRESTKKHTVTDTDNNEIRCTSKTTTTTTTTSSTTESPGEQENELEDGEIVSPTFSIHEPRQIIHPIFVRRK